MEVGNSLAAVPIVQDSYGVSIQDRFLNYLRTAQHGTVSDSQSSESQDHLNEFVQQISVMKEQEHTTLSVDMSVLAAEDQELADCIIADYYRLAPFLNKAVQSFIDEKAPEYVKADAGPKEFFASFYNYNNPVPLRALHTDSIGKLSCITGTVTRTTEVRPELLYGAFRCESCGTLVTDVEQQFKYTEPKICPNVHCQDKNHWQIDLDLCKFVDWQRVRLQENTDEIPPGSMPRSMDIILRHDVVEHAKPGDKVKIVGTLIVVPDVSQMTKQGQVVTSEIGKRNRADRDEGIVGLHDMGQRSLTYSLSFLATSIIPVEGGLYISEETLEKEMTPELRAEIIEMRKTPLLYQHLSSSIAPYIYGHDDIKKGLLLMLMGGVHKDISEGAKLRGDINICIVGDPSTAKSQFLKYINSIVPRSVYTSGKSSSAAGLTVSVGRDHDTGEMCIEAGALMLSDNGICCIDEFDKIDIYDQVAIHEAMEQQTISITKAGIQATLNARASILAAANPINGRYDRTKSLRQNIQFSPAIMSRFDLFFVVLDDVDPTTDYSIATHIIRTHMHNTSRQPTTDTEDDGTQPYFTTKQVQNYIRFARQFNPKITEESKQTLVECYRDLRQNDAIGSKTQTSYRITVRQLESLIRLSEALARLYLDEEVKPSYVREAYRLLQKSIIHIESGDVTLDEHDDDWNDDFPVQNPVDHEEEENEGGIETKDTFRISYEEYKKISNAIVVILREEAKKGGSVTINTVVSNILTQIPIMTYQELGYKRKVVTRIIRRLIKHDHVLEITCDISNKEEGDWTIDVHPNYLMS